MKKNWKSTVRFENFLNNNQVEFINNLKYKKENLKKEVRDIDSKKGIVIEKIIEYKKNIELSPKETRENTGSAETALESIENVYKNLLNIQNSYENLEKQINDIGNTQKKETKTNDFKDRMNRLALSIDDIIRKEEETEEDNKKNYIIINGFIKQTQESTKDDDFTDLENLTLDNLQDNMILRIGEKKVELPYSKKEVENYMKTYPDEYKTVEDVIRKEFIIHSSIFNKHPILSRFKEAYYLCRTKEMMSILDSFNYAKSIMFKSNINSYIIAAVKSKKQLEDYIYCLENDKMDLYKHFKIIFDVTPLATVKI